MPREDDAAPQDPPPPEEKGIEGQTKPGPGLKEHAGFAYLVSRGLIRDQNMRRNVMCWFIMAAVIVLFVGAVFIDDYLRVRPMQFAVYWLFCAWLTLSAVMLAIFDILLQFAKGRATRKALTKGMLMAELERIKNEHTSVKKE